ncbi:Potassium voltage-gated channel sub H member 7 [Podochytrium sp. JEL0797]|nr:Potassium voltage-gated channel sub H member 7 [Podochytrium sp. JEL0797]
MFYQGSLYGFAGWKDAWPAITSAGVFQFYSFTFFKAAGNLFPQAFGFQNPSEQLLCVTCALFGAILYAVFIATVSSAAMSINPSSRLYVQKLEELKDYIKWKELSPETEDKLFSYYETKYRMTVSSVMQEVSLHNTRDLILKVPFLQRQEGDGRDEIWIGRIAIALHAQHYIAGDYIIKQGEAGFDMFFIVSGKVDVFVNDKKVVSFFDGAYLGEVALICTILRTATVQAAIPSILYRLNCRDFREILNEFPDMKRQIDLLAEERDAVIKQAEEN